MPQALIIFAVRCLLATAALFSVAAARQPLFEAELAVGGLNEPHALSDILRDVGLHSIGDVQHLNSPEQLELSESLRAAGVDLGSRSRLRRLSDGAAGVPTAASSHESFWPVESTCRGGNSLQPRRAQTKEGVAEADVQGGGGLSMDTLALMSTAVLGIATFVLQAQVAKNAEAAQQDLERARVEQERERERAAVQLERVRSQMGDVYRPVQVMLGQADSCSVDMQRELGFEFNDVWGLEFVRPFVLWPQVEVLNRKFGPKWFTALKGSPYKKHSLADIALLEDPAKRQLYIEAHAGCMAPRYREVATILATKGHLLQRPPPALLDRIFPDGIADWTKFSQGTLITLQYDMGAFADTWAPLERRWEAGDFSRMQPAQPNPRHALSMVVVNMMATAGARQKELEGASSSSGRKAAGVDAISGVTASTQDDT